MSKKWRDIRREHSAEAEERIRRRVEEIMDEVTIPREEYEELQRRSKMLAALIAAGVDNWEGYDQAMEMLED